MTSKSTTIASLANLVQIYTQQAAKIKHSNDHVICWTELRPSITLSTENHSACGV